MSDLLPRARKALEMGNMCGLVTTRPGNIYQILGELITEVERLSFGPVKRLPFDYAAIAADYAHGMSMREIQAKHKCSKQTARRAAVQHGLALRDPHRPYGGYQGEKA